MHLPIQARVNNYQLADTVTWVKQNHLLKFGTDILRSQFSSPITANSAATTSSRAAGPATRSPISCSASRTPPRASWALPRSTSSPPTSASSPRTTGRSPHGSTLNLGLRYEITTPLTEKYGRMATFIPETGKIIVADDRTTPDFDRRVQAAGMADQIGAARDYGIPKGLVDTRYRRLAPRFGFGLAAGRGGPRGPRRLWHLLRGQPRPAHPQRFRRRVPLRGFGNLQPRADQSRRAHALRSLPRQPHAVRRRHQRQRLRGARPLAVPSELEHHPRARTRAPERPEDQLRRLQGHASRPSSTTSTSPSAARSTRSRGPVPIPG